MTHTMLTEHEINTFFSLFRSPPHLTSKVKADTSLPAIYCTSSPLLPPRSMPSSGSQDLGEGRHTHFSVQHLINLYLYSPFAFPAGIKRNEAVREGM